MRLPVGFFLVLDHGLTFLWGYLLLLVILLNRQFHSSCDALINSRVPHVLSPFILAWRFHDFGYGWLSLDLFMMRLLLLYINSLLHLFKAAGDCSTLVLLFQVGRFSELSPLELILLSLI